MLKAGRSIADLSVMSAGPRESSVSSRAQVPAPSGPAVAEPARTALSIVVPMFRETQRIGPTIAALAASALHRPGVEFVFVDDGSPDDTAQVAVESIERVALLGARVLRLPENQGKGAAVRAGVLATTGDLVAFIDADLSFDLADLDRALVALSAAGADLLVGHRIVDMAHQPIGRRAASLLFRVVTAAMAPTGVVDSQCALKLFRRSVVAELFEPLRTNGFGFDVELLVRARRSNMVVTQLRIGWEHQEGSKVDPVRDGLTMLNEVARIRSLARSRDPQPVPLTNALAVNVVAPDPSRRELTPLPEPQPA